MTLDELLAAHPTASIATRISRGRGGVIHIITTYYYDGDEVGSSHWEVQKPASVDETVGDIIRDIDIALNVRAPMRDKA